MNLLKKEKTLRKDEFRVAECFNLRPAAGSAGDVLAVVGTPQVIASASWKPLARVGDSLLVFDGTTLGVVTDSGVTEVATLPSSPRCAQVSQAYVNIMTDSGLYLLKRNDDGSLSDVGVLPDFGAISITAESIGSIDSTVDACATENITAGVTAAYRQIVETARIAGAYVQPVVARCRLLDGDGNVVHVTAPVAVMLSSGAQLADAWQFATEDNGATVQAKTFSAEAFRLRVTVGSTVTTAWQNVVQTLEVQATPQFHPVNFSGTATVNISRDGYVRVTLPGVERGLSGTRYLAATDLLKRTLERFDSIASTVAYVNNPYANTSTVVSISAAVNVADESDKLASALATSTPAHLSNVLARVLTPHSFIADAVADCADTVVWTNIVPKRFGGYNAGVYASTFESKACSGYVSITFASGERVVNVFSANISPLTLSPLLTYPSAEAQSMTIVVCPVGAGSARTLTVSLSPDATGAYAYYVSPTLQPLSMQTTTSATAPTAVSGDLAMPGVVGVSNAGAVPRMSAVCSVGTNLLNIIAARSGSSAWEYRRARFYAFADDGIKLLTVNGSRSECAVNLLDCRTIDNKYCVADGGNVVYALCGGTLLQLSSNTVKAVMHNVSGDRLAWLANDNEIVVANTDDNEATHLCPDFSYASFTTTLVARGPWYAAAGNAYAVADTGLVDLADRDVASATSVRWKAAYVVDKGHRVLPAGVRWMLKAERFSGTLTASRMWLSYVSPKPLYISRLSVNGAIKSPILSRFNGHRTIDMLFSVEGDVSRDFSLTSPMIVCTK